jgi:hypothetical protein
VNQKKENEYFVPESGRYYFRVGKYAHGIHKDHFIFSFTVTRKGDLDSEIDAGDTNQTAIQIVPGEYKKNSGGLADKEDRFKLAAKKGEKYSFEMVPEDENSPDLSLEITDSLKIRISSQSRGGGYGQGMQASFEIPEDGDYYMIVKYNTPHNGGHTDYSLKLTKKE